jgi:hypothetical protein
MMGQGDPLPQPMPIPTHQPCMIAAKAHQQTIACLLANRLTAAIELGFLNQHPGAEQSSYHKKRHRNRNKTQFH